MKYTGLTEREEKMYEKMLEYFSINSDKNRKFLEQFYQIDRGDNEK